MRPVPFNCPQSRLTARKDQGSTNAAYVNSLYANILNRTADPVGAASWTAALNAGAMTRTQVAYNMLVRPEYETDLIDQYYLTYLGRPADPLGKATWLHALQTGLTEQAVLSGILGSPDGYLKWS